MRHEKDPGFSDPERGDGGAERVAAVGIFGIQRHETRRYGRPVPGQRQGVCMSQPVEPQITPAAPTSCP